MIVKQVVEHNKKKWLQPRQAIVQEMYSMDIDILETILIPKNMCEDGYVWILGPWSFRVIGRSNSQMQASIVLLTNESNASTCQMSEGLEHFYVLYVR